MCGFVGTASTQLITERGLLRVARDTLIHRGPDDSGEWWSSDGRVGLAHRRLAILDLSFAGHQPMQSADRNCSIVFNGEIYNHSELRRELRGYGYDFRSNSDTEVLLAAYAQWGGDCLSRLNGMFAFAIYDARRMQLFAARDRAGEKPFFYFQDNDTLYFSSELKGLLVHPRLPRRVDPEALDCYLAMGFIPGDRCILQGYKKLPPAHTLLFDCNTGSVTVRRYWQLPETVDSTEVVSENALVEELAILLEKAVATQMVADVPVGILLSGGIDSSLITAMAVRHSSKVRTFSVGFPGHGASDETPYARFVARFFGTEHTELIAEPTSADLLPILARQFDEPIVDSSMFPTYLVSHLVRQHCTVALGGDGGDELFAGYDGYSRLLWMQKRLVYLPYGLRHLIAWTATNWLPVGLKGRNYLQGLDIDLRYDLPLLASYFDSNHRRRLLQESSGHGFVAEKIRSARVPRQRDLLQRATRMDFENYLPEDILVKVDRASMLNSLEVRSPFLDYRMIEFAFGKVPARLKATERDRKILLKKLIARVLPAGFNRDRKQGFSIPLSSWLKRGPFRQLFWDTLESNDCLFDSKTVRSLLAGQDKNRRNGERLFALVQFELWRKIYKVNL